MSKTKDGENDENLIEENEDDSEKEDEEKIFEQFMTKPKEKWDCESIISTYSNIYNHPKLITEESTKKYELHKRTGIPIGVFAESAKKVDNDEDVDSEMLETVTLNNVRNKDETPEQRKQRKKDVKEQRKNRRIEKKSNKIAFKSEQKKQEKVNSNTIAQRGIKL